MQKTEKQDIYTRITNQIVSHLEKGVRPWVRPWNAEHAAGRITRPLRHNGKPYSGFNVEQIEGLPEVYYAKAAPNPDPVARIDHAEQFFAALGATIRHGGNRAFYSIAADAIQMPPFESFQDADSYYATLAHECTHWTGSKTRLDRDFGGHRFGSEGYAVEELVAELGAAFLCADLELALEPREDHASYIATWLKVLAADN